MTLKEIVVVAGALDSTFVRPMEVIVEPQSAASKRRARRHKLSRAEEMLRAVQWELSEERWQTARLRDELLNVRAQLDAAEKRQRERREQKG